MSKKQYGKQRPKEDGGDGFSENYWRENYDEPEEMDGIVNAAQHARYIKTIFDVEFVDISSVIDFGFGLGHIFEKVIHEFYPYRVFGLEPSKYAFNEVKKRDLCPVASTKLVLKNWSLQDWAKNYQKKEIKWFDLGLCTSVFQYLTEEEIEEVLPLMARQVKYLYFSVPTDLELKKQVSDLEFDDQYAYRRSKTFYRKAIKPHFTIVGNRLLESKFHFNEDNSYFTDYLFRE